MAAVLQHTERTYGRTFRPVPEQVPALTLAPLEPHGWSTAAPLYDNRADRMVDYIALLNATTDDQWRFAMAEGDQYRRGARHFAKLWALQVELDPKGFIWSTIAPEGFAIPQPRIVGAAS